MKLADLSFDLEVKGFNEYLKTIEEISANINKLNSLIKQINEMELEVYLKSKRNQDKTRIDNKYENAYDSFDKIINYEFDLEELFNFHKKHFTSTYISIADIVSANLDDEMLNVYSVLDDLVKTSKM